MSVNFSNGYSKNNKDKYDNVRLETSPINKIVISYSVCDGDLARTVSTLHSRGASVHYLIDKDGTQYQEHNDFFKTFFAASGKFKGESTNETGISIMLINDAKSEYTEAQILKLNALLNELMAKHQITDVFGLNEVYLSWNKTENKPVFMEAPGALFPWEQLSKAGISKSIIIPEGMNNECIENLTSEALTAYQTNLQTFGYNIPTINGEFDDYTQHFTKVINTRYAHSSEECITAQTLFIADSLAGKVDTTSHEL